MFDIKENLKKLPDKPGVYMHKDKLGQVIYVGKAISLRNRVRQYFQSAKNQDSKVRAMVSHIEEFEYITTNTEMEALILENNLIKKYMPKYNVLLRDDKTYPYIKVTTNEEFPRLVKTRKISNDGAKYFGPYTDVGAVNQIIELLNNIYSLKRCSTQKFPKDFKPCLNYHINQCEGICNGDLDKVKYNEAIDQVVDFLNGKNKDILAYLNEKMSEEAQALNFEKAAEYRDYIAAVNAIAEKQRVVMLAAGDMDVILAAKGHKGAHVIMFFIRNGRLNGRETFHLQAMTEHEEREVVSGFIKQYYSDNSMIPKEIIVEKQLPEYELTEEWLSMMRGSRVKILVPQKGDKKALLDLAKHDVIEMVKTLDDRAQRQMEKTNIINTSLEQIFGKATGRSEPFKQPQTTEQQKSANQLVTPGQPQISPQPESTKQLVPTGQPQASGLTRQTGPPGLSSELSPSKPWRIEAYDISNTGGVDSVGAMVVFEGSRPVRKDYRRFKIRTVEGANDYGSLQEVLYRRFKRGKEGDKGFAKIPDLILMDGGKAQVSAASQVLKAMELDIPVAGMVKDEKHRTRALVYLDNEIDLKMNPILYKYVATIQEEVHRFAIEYHRGLRNRKLQRSVLDEIEGVGEKRKNALLTYFGSIEKIKEADMEELRKVPGMTEPVAKNVREWSLKSAGQQPLEKQIKNE